jgi:hypothetical protein
MEKIGLVREGVLEALYAFPLVVDSNDGTPSEIFTIYGINDDGSLDCGQDVPIGGTLKIGSVTGDLILETAGHITDLALRAPGDSGILLFSCISRNIVLSDPEDEIRTVLKEMKNCPVPYLFLYAGGEICPLTNKKEKLINSFHQYTIIGCRF